MFVTLQLSSLHESSAWLFTTVVLSAWFIHDIPSAVGRKNNVPPLNFFLQMKNSPWVLNGFVRSVMDFEGRKSYHETWRQKANNLSVMQVWGMSSSFIKEKFKTAFSCVLPIFLATLCTIQWFKQIRMQRVLQLE